MVAGVDFLSGAGAATAAAAAWIVLPLSVYLLLSGLDDLFHDILALYHRRAQDPVPSVPDRPTAILIPLWQEDEVIAKMVRHNLGTLRYSQYDCFVGVYPNDRKTAHVVRRLAEEFPRVHLAMLPHAGPTVKADCLNWAFQHMLLFEEQTGIRYENIVIHDAEDVMYPDSLRAINAALSTAGMAQYPVLPFATPASSLTHGVYCDDFAEGQAMHLRARVGCGAFLPGCGVGTGFRREAIEALASSSANQVFDPESLTEDYDVGLRLYALGFNQTFIPLLGRGTTLAATREYFPATITSAIRQRTRWIIGNSLQSWRKHGWGRGPLSSWRNRYFLWRDRKGVWGNPLSLICNGVLVYGALSLACGQVTGGPWQFARSLPHGPVPDLLYLINSLLYLERIVARTCASASVYGVRFALLAPVRMLYGNWINCWASAGALARFGRAWLRDEPLRWVKTEHAFPSRAALTVYRRLLGEILVQSAYIEQEDLDRALATCPPGRRLGEHLVAMNVLSERELYEALSLQSSLPLASVDPDSIDSDVFRSLPRWAIRIHRAVAFASDTLQLNIATPDLPSEEAQRQIATVCGLDVAFHLVTPANFEAILKSHTEYEGFR